jgi:hypothetical protein
MVIPAMTMPDDGGLAFLRRLNEYADGRRLIREAVQRFTDAQAHK